MLKSLPDDAGHTRDPDLIPGLEASLGEEMTTRFSILAWRIPWGRAWRVTVHVILAGSQRVRHD